jgi:hypothetical protein
MSEDGTQAGLGEFVSPTTPTEPATEPTPETVAPADDTADGSVDHEVRHAQDDALDDATYERLLTVADGLDAPHGLAVKEEIERWYPGEVHNGRLYPNLDELVEKGLVSKSQRDRRTNEYRVTRRGQDLLGAHDRMRAQYRGE